MNHNIFEFNWKLILAIILNNCERKNEKGRVAIAVSNETGLLPRLGAARCHNVSHQGSKKLAVYETTTMNSVREKGLLLDRRAKGREGLLENSTFPVPKWRPGASPNVWDTILIYLSHKRVNRRQ